MKIKSILSVIMSLALSNASHAERTAGDIATNFTMKNRATGQEISLYDYEGQIVLLDFFAYWCGPCNTSSPDVEQNIARYFESQGGNAHGIPVTVIAVSIELRNPANTDAFVTNSGIQLATDDHLGQGWTQFGEGGIPHFAVVNGADSKNFKKWEVLVSRPGYYGAAFYKSLINQVEKNPVAENISFADWIAASGVPAHLRGPSHDPDGDSETNLMEYACGHDPAKKSKGTQEPLLKMTIGQNGLPGLQYDRSQSAIGIRDEIQVMDARGQWSPLIVADRDITVSPQVDRETVFISLTSQRKNRLILRRVVTVD